MTVTAFPASEDFANGSSVLSSSAPLHLSLVESSSDRAYGTFEVSVIDMESENEHDDGDDIGSNDDEYFQAKRNAKESEIGPCGGGLCYSLDCCFLMAFLCAPIRLCTYKALLFHVANFLVAVVATAWMTGIFAVKLFAICASSSRAFARRFESRALSTLLQVDTALFNFISPPEECVRVYSSATNSFLDASEYVDLQVRLYFGVIKLACSAVPGLISAGVFLWSLQRLFLITLCAFSSSSSSCDAVAFDSAASALHAHFLTTAAQDLDVLAFMAVLAVYSATMLLQVFAYISRHVTVFFCAEHLRFTD